MANLIKIKRSSVPGKVPSTVDLDYGELAVNTFDGKLFIKKNDGSEKVISIDSAYVQSAPPTNAIHGQLWFDPDSNVLSIYYEDVDSGQWIETTPNELLEGPIGTFTLDGNLIVTGTLFETSDANLKENVQDILDPLSTIEALRGVTFDWKETQQHSMGVIAQEVESVLPYLVNTSPDGTKSVNYNALVGVLIESIKELNRKLKEHGID